MADNFTDSLSKLQNAAKDAAPDSFFKNVLRRYRKYYKKLEKISKAEDKIENGGELTPEIEDMLKSKSNLVFQLEELDFMVQEFYDEQARVAKELEAQKNELEAEKERLASTKVENSDEIRQEAYNEGFENGKQEGLKEGEESGRKQADKNSAEEEFQRGQISGYDQGFQEGYTKGKDEGVEEGKQQAASQLSQQKDSSSEHIRIIAAFFAINNLIREGVNLAPMFMIDEHMTQHQYAAVKALEHIISYPPTKADGINFKDLTHEIYEVFQKLVQYHDS